MERHCAPSWLCEGFKSKGLSPRDSNTVPGTPGEARVDGLLLEQGLLVSLAPIGFLVALVSARSGKGM